jgi:signal peptidase
MADNAPSRDLKSLVTQLRTSDHWAASSARDILWVIGVVGSIALLLFVLCGTWPAVVTIESGSMIPNMNIGDLVVVVQKDRFGDLQTWDDGKKSGYKKFGDYGDVIIYRPNGFTDVWASVGLLPLSKQHPIIHRAMTLTEAGKPVPLYLNPYRGTATPAGYLPLIVTSQNVSGFRVLSTGSVVPRGNYTPGANDLLQIGKEYYLMPADAIVPNMGYIWPNWTTTTHGGYITKGDNNLPSDQGTLPVDGRLVEPVQKDWVVGKALFTVPYVGLLPLHIGEVLIVVIILMVLHELYLRRKEKQMAEKEAAEESQKTGGKKQQ